MKKGFYEKLITSMLLLFATIVVVLRVILSLSYLPEIGGGMSINMLYGIQHLSQTGILYTNPEAPPFAIIQYTPLYYYLIDIKTHFLNLSGNLHQVMVFHRLICLFCNLVYCFLVYWIIRKLFDNVPRLIALSAGLILFCFTPCLSFERLDNVYLLFIITSIGCFLNYVKQYAENKTDNLKYVIWSGIFCSLALLTKQTAIWTIALGIIWLLLFRKSVKFAVVYSICVLLPFIIVMFLASHGEFHIFKLNVVDGLKNGININWFYQVFIKGYFMRFSILIVFGLYIAGWHLLDRTNQFKFFIGFSILFYFLTALAFSFKLGATQNYYTEFTIMSLLGICYLINSRPEIHVPYLPIIALYIPFFLLSCANDKGWKNISKLNSAKNDFVNCQAIADYLNPKMETGNYIYSNFHTENCLNLMMTKAALFPNREVAFNQTYPQGVFKFEKLQELMDKSKIQFIIDRKDSFPDKILYAKTVNFIPDTIIGNYSIYKTANR